MGAASRFFAGPVTHEALAAFDRAIAAGVSTTRALALAQVASFKDGWILRRNIARRVGCHVRTVARAFAEGRAKGLLQTYRAKKNEVPKGRTEPLTCGWSHRITVGWGLGGAAVKQAIADARARRLQRRALPKDPPRRGPSERRRWSAPEVSREELEARKRKALAALAEAARRWELEDAGKPHKPPD